MHDVNRQAFIVVVVNIKSKLDVQTYHLVKDLLLYNHIPSCIEFKLFPKIRLRSNTFIPNTSTKALLFLKIRVNGIKLFNIVI